MTYNFDPDRWLETHRTAAKARHARGEIDEATLEAELLDLDRRYDKMVTRLDGTYEIPTSGSSLD